VAAATVSDRPSGTASRGPHPFGDGVAAHAGEVDQFVQLHGMCRMHETRVRRHGDINAVHDSGAPPGKAHPRWRGTDIRYRTAHDRVVRRWGKASEHSCIDCGDQAVSWSYNGTDPEELSGPGRPTADGSFSVQRWSADPSHYSPRCHRCHKRFDVPARRRQHIERVVRRYRKRSADCASQSESSPQQNL
jgi:hypothetical protein